MIESPRWKIQYSFVYGNAIETKFQVDTSAINKTN